MKKLTYKIIINESREYVFNKLTDKSVYPEWAKAWGDGMTYKGEWKKGEKISFIDNSQGGTKVVLEKFEPYEYIRAKHIAMVDADNNEKESKDDMIKNGLAL